jgi:hypothetical protein
LIVGVTSVVGEAARSRVLAGDERAGRYSRGEGRRRHRAFLRSRWRLLVLVVLFAAAPIAALAYLVTDPLARGLVIGVGLAGTIGGIAHVVSTLTGTGPLFMGELAEQWTAAELRSLRKQGWRLVNHAGLTTGDIDHILIGPGGIVVVETKWSATSWGEDWNLNRVRRATVRAAEDAHRLGLWLRQLEVPAPLSLVVLWGGEADELPQRPAGTTGVVRGSGLRGQIDALAGGVLSEQKVQQVWGQLDEQVRRRDPHEAALHPVPPSLQQVAGQLCAAVFAGLCSVLLVAEVVTVAGSAWFGVAAAVLAAAVSWPLRKVDRLAVVMTGWLTGFAAALALIALSFGAFALH